MTPDRILRMFPRAWRERYADEVRTLLESDTVRWRTRLDLVTACGDAWCRQGLVWGRQGVHVAWHLLVLALFASAVWALGWTIGVGAEALVATRASSSAPRWVGALIGLKVPLVIVVYFSNWPESFWLSGRLQKRLSLAGVLAGLLAIMVLEEGAPGFMEAMAVGMLVSLPYLSPLRAAVVAVTEWGRVAPRPPPAQTPSSD